MKRAGGLDRRSVRVRVRQLAGKVKDGYFALLTFDPVCPDM